MGLMSRKYFELFDLAVTVSAGTLCMIHMQDVIPGSKALKVICVLKLARFLRLIGRFEPYSVIFMVIGNLAPFLFELAMSLYLVFYIFNITGIFLWSGHIKIDTPQDSKSPEFYPKNYEYLNFNDFASGFITLFSILVVNNWVVVATCFTTFISFQKGLRWFFLIFYMMANLLSMYILIGVVIDVAVTNLAENIQSNFLKVQIIEGMVFICLCVCLKEEILYIKKIEKPKDRNLVSAVLEDRGRNDRTTGGTRLSVIQDKFERAVKILEGTGGNPPTDQGEGVEMNVEEDRI
jgi:Ion transport protein